MKIVINKSNIILLLYMILSAIYTSPLFSLQRFNSVLYYLYYFNMIFIVFGFMTMIYKKDIKFLALSVCETVTLTIICLLNGTEVRQWIVILTLTIGMYYVTNITYVKSFFQILTFVGLAYNLVSFVISPGYYQQWYESESIMNPNTIGIMNLFYAVIINSYIHLYISSKIKRCLYIFYNGFVMYILYIYRGRTSQFAFVLFIVLFLLTSIGKIINNKKIINAIMIGINIGGVLFPLLYTMVPKTLINWIADYSGKSYFSGREVIWGRFYLALMDFKNFLIGPGYWRKAEYTTLWSEKRVYSMHNNFLYIVLCFGMIGLFLYALFSVFRVIQMHNEGRINNIVGFSGFLAFMILGYTENTFSYAFFVVAFNLLLGMSSCGNIEKKL